MQFRDVVVFVPPLPVFRVNFGWARRAYGRLWSFGRDLLALATVGLSAGLVIDPRVGVLYELNPEGREVVYEVARWD